MPGRIDAAIRIPDGRLASADEMRECSRSLQRFVCETEARLPAMADSREHDRVVDFLREIAGRFNEQLRVFREAEQRRVAERQLLWARLLAASITPAQRHTRH